MTDELPPFKLMMKSAREDGVYNMYVEVDKFVKAMEASTITEGEYHHPPYKVNPSSLEGYFSSWAPTELKVYNRTPDDEARAEGYKRQQMRDENPPNKDVPLSDEEKQERLNNINANNADLGLAPSKERLPSANGVPVQLGTSVRSDPKANALANRFIERR